MSSHHAFYPVADLAPFAPDVSIYAGKVLANQRCSEHRIAIVWDADRDERILNIAAALYYRHPEVFTQLYALHEHKATLHVLMEGAHDARPAATRAEFDAICRDWRLLGDSWKHDVVWIAPTTRETGPGIWHATNPIVDLTHVHAFAQLGMLNTQLHRGAQS